MWFVLRLLTLVVVYLWKFLWRRQSIGEYEPFGDEMAAKKMVRHKGKFTRAFHGLTYNGPLEFQFSKERGWDTFFKNLGLAVEQQTDDPEFDAEIYITCDQPSLGDMLRGRDSARRALLALFRAGVKRVFADGAYVWAEVTEENHDVPGIRRNLAQLRDGLRAIDPAHHRSRRDSFFWRALAIESLAWSVACYGVPGFIELAWSRHTIYPDSFPIFKLGLVCSLVVFAFLFALIVALLRGSSRGHRIIFESFVLLVIGVPLSTVQAVSDVNIELDPGPPQWVQSHVSDKQIEVRRRRRGTSRHYYLYLQTDGVRAQSIPGKIEVESSIYHASRQGGDITVLLRNGRLGVPWIEAVRP